MGRKRIELNCPKCGQLGRPPRPKRTKYGEYLYVEHYDPVKKKILKTCYIENILRENELQEIRNGPFPEAGLLRYELVENCEKLLRTLDVIKDRIAKTDITPADKKILASLFRDGNEELQTIFWAYSVYPKLKSKDDRTIEETNLLKGIEEFLDKINKTFCQTNKMIDFINRCRRGQIKDPNTPESRKIIRENKPGFDGFSDLSINRALSYWFDKYERPKREARINALKEKYSEGGLGSEKYSGTVGN